MRPVSLMIVASSMSVLCACLPAPEIAKQDAVIDRANVLSAGTEAQISELADSIRVDHGSLIVLTVPGLDGKPITQYADDFGNGHIRGTKGGVVLLVAPNDRQVRISTTDDMMGRLTNEEAATIVAQMIERFKVGDIEGGVTLGAGEIRTEMMGR